MSAPSCAPGPPPAHKVLSWPALERANFPPYHPQEAKEAEDEIERRQMKFQSHLAKQDKMSAAKEIKFMKEEGWFWPKVAIHSLGLVGQSF